MTMTDAQRAANRRWDKKHMSTVGCRVNDRQRAKLNEYAEAHKTSLHALIKAYLLGLIEENSTNTELTPPTE